MSEIKNYFYNVDSPFEDLGNGLKRKVLAHHENLMAVEVHLEKGAEGTMHSHPHEQICYVLKGRFEFNIDGKKQVIEPGDSVYLEANVPHGVICLEEGILLDIFTPHREDFIQKEIGK